MNFFEAQPHGLTMFQQLERLAAENLRLREELADVDSLLLRRSSIAEFVGAKEHEWRIKKLRELSLPS